MVQTYTLNKALPKDVKQTGQAKQLFLETVTREIQKIDPAYTCANYDMTDNVMNEDDSAGSIIMLYRIGNTVKTNAAYILDYQSDVLNTVSKNKYVNTIETVDETSILNAIGTFKQTKTYSDIQNDLASKTDAHEEFYFDYESGLLSYRAWSFAEKLVEGQSYMMEDYCKSIHITY